MLEKTFKLILGSQSPRRKELLTHLDIPFTIVTADLDEVSTYSLPDDVVRDLAIQKGQAVLTQCLKNDFGATPLVISSDTIVCLGDEIFNKPNDVDDARRILQTLSGKTHIVRTAVAFTCPDMEPYSFIVATEVTFDIIAPEILESYLMTGDSLDKAGAYGIQGPSLTFISSIKGSYSAVVGFPLSDVVTHLKKFIGDESKNWRERFIK